VSSLPTPCAASWRAPSARHARSPRPAPATRWKRWPCTSPTPTATWTSPRARYARQLRAQAKQLGDGESRHKPGAYEIKHLAEKLAYDQWHRLLFARYLLENKLLISPEHGVAVSLDDCEELAPSVGLKDAWAVAARFAAKELPEIFRADDPAGAVELAVNDRQPLIALVTGLPVEVFTASDSLGWCYQFWQAEKKDEVNAAGNKIGADELPAVTQLFTEDYMVDFLLDNTLGAWHAGKVLAANPNWPKPPRAKTNFARPSRWRAARGSTCASSRQGRQVDARRRHLRRLAQGGARTQMPRPVHGQRAFRGGDVRAAGGLALGRGEAGRSRRGGGRHPRQPVRLGDRPALHADWRVQPGAGGVAARGPSAAAGDEPGLLRPRAECEAGRLAETGRRQ
jgi:hypothetical protein